MKRSTILFIVGVIICAVGMSMSILITEAIQEGAQPKAPKEDSRIPVYYRTADIEDESGCAERRELQLYKYEIYRYDGDGNRTGQYEYDADGSLHYYKQQRYDKWDNRIQEVYEYRLLSGKTENYWQYEYDADGNITRKTSLSKDGVPSYSSYYRYEDSGVICVTVYYDSGGGVSSFDSEIRDENGNRLLDYNYDADGNRTSYTYAEYDGDGRYIYQTNGRGETDGSPMKELITEWDDETHSVSSSSIKCLLRVRKPLLCYSG